MPNGFFCSSAFFCGAFAFFSGFFALVAMAYSFDDGFFVAIVVPVIKGMNMFLHFIPFSIFLPAAWWVLLGLCAYLLLLQPTHLLVLILTAVLPLPLAKSHPLGT